MTRPLRWAWIALTGIALQLVGTGQSLAQEEGEEEESTTSLTNALEQRQTKPLDVVQNRAFYKRHRLEIFSHLYASALNNSFANRFLSLSGGSVAYHIGESWFIEGVVDFFPDYTFINDLKPLNTGIATYLGEGEYIPDVPKETFYGGLSLGFSPIYGKINLVGSYVQSFDISFVGGVGILQIRKDRYQVATSAETGATELIGPQSPTTTSFLSPGLGLTTRFFLNQWLTLRADARFHGYIEKVTSSSPTQDEDTGDYLEQKNTFKGSFILAAGLSGFVPFHR